VGGNDDEVQYEDNGDNSTPSSASMELSSADEADSNDTIGSDDNDAMSRPWTVKTTINKQQ